MIIPAIIVLTCIFAVAGYLEHRTLVRLESDPYFPHYRANRDRSVS